MTWASLENGSDYANAMLGHSGYLGQYFRLGKHIREDKYLKLEPSLTIFEHPNSIGTIKKLERESKKYEQLEKKQKILEETIQRLKDKGVL